MENAEIKYIIIDEELKNMLKEHEKLYKEFSEVYDVYKQYQEEYLEKKDPLAQKIFNKYIELNPEEKIDPEKNLNTFVVDIGERFGICRYEKFFDSHLCKERYPDVYEACRVPKFLIKHMTAKENPKEERKEEKKTVTNAELEERYPEICTFIRENEKTKDDGVRYEKIREKFGQTEKQLVALGFHGSGNKPRTDGVGLRKIFMPQNSKGV